MGFQAPGERFEAQARDSPKPGPVRSPPATKNPRVARLVILVQDDSDQKTGGVPAPDPEDVALWGRHVTFSRFLRRDGDHE
jgi:hypothetical protein